MKIAVVDDDKAICEAIAQLIKNQESEAEVCQFSSGKEMLETGENFAISFLMKRHAVWFPFLRFSIAVSTPFLPAGSRPRHPFTLSAYPE